MKVYVVEYRHWDDSELVGVFTSADIAEKYIEQSIKTCFGNKATTQMYRARYSIFIEDVIGE
jgi:hypothetical protein